MLGTARLFACRGSTISRWSFTPTVLLQRPLSLRPCAELCTRRCASSRATHAARSAAAARPKNKESSPPPTAATGRKASTAPAAPRQQPARRSTVSAEKAADEERRRREELEKEVRLGMRHLMSEHLTHSPELRAKRIRRTEKRRQLQHASMDHRHRRLQEKDANSERLLGTDSTVLGDGIVPLLSTTSKNPYESVGGVAVWGALNPVGLSASQAAVSDSAIVTEGDYASFLAQAAGSSDGETDEDVDGWRSATLASLCSPDLSVYDSDRDFRINSEEAVRLAEGESTKDATSSTPDEVASTSPTQSASSSAAAAAMRMQLDEGDSDYTVSMFTDDFDDPLSL
ncbi:hypothetical protein NESM_000400500 [Novymonas esmeraldas]|uniref:Uncharacterized protein n=1 Tax=Novymonas esmeraldas TaxID=1808958 RepID=A0AAW0ENM5_9TRYP